MSDDQNTPVSKDYIISCLLAVSCAVIGLASPQHQEFFKQGISAGFLIILILIIFILIGFYFQLKPSNSQKGESEDPAMAQGNAQRMKKMSIIWYILSIVLAGSLMRPLVSDPIEFASAATWLFASLGIAVVFFALWRLLLVLKPRRS